MRWLVCLLFAAAASVAAARDALPLSDDPALEQRVMHLSSELRCLVCQNETLADSHADLAVDLRNQVREQMRAGKSDEQIKEWLTQRYGDFVLYRPPVKSSTWVLWFGPFVLLVVAGAVFVTYLRRRSARTEVVQLTAEAHRRAQALLAEDMRDGAP